MAGYSDRMNVFMELFIIFLSPKQKKKDYCETTVNLYNITAMYINWKVLYTSLRLSLMFHFLVKYNVLRMPF